VLAGVVACAQTFGLAQNKDSRAGRDVPVKTRGRSGVWPSPSSPCPPSSTYHTPRADKTRAACSRTLAATDRTVGFVNEKTSSTERRTEAVSTKKRVRLLNLWLDAGHELGTQTPRPLEPLQDAARGFQQDVIRGEEITGKLMSSAACARVISVTPSSTRGRPRDERGGGSLPRRARLPDSSGDD
jgi:hypothetical protein